ncbi:MAG: hypothetical protein IJN41_08905 [Firmicutes bacterium]|nr:hypothetical protein [Bacillota bacterium]
MKIRRSFVTNSSSSSFLIGKAEESLTKDMIFRMICGFYQEYFKIKDQIKARMDEFPGLYWDPEYEGFTFPDDEVSWGDYFEAERRLEETFGIHSWSHFSYDVGWWDLNTYQEYLDYWKPKAKDMAFPPFEIVDYQKDEEDDCLCGEDIFDWYVKCDGTTDAQTEDCEACEMEFDDERCREYRQGVKEGRITKKNRREQFLGRFCIDSWEGDIPYWVAEKLAEISRFACIHMG